MRLYTKNDKDYVSVTTILDKMYPFNRESFEKWCNMNSLDPDMILNQSTIMGSKVSNWIDNHNRGLTMIDQPVVTEYETGLRKAVDKFLSDYDILQTEQTVYNDELLYAGTLDGIVDVDGTEYLADWKTYGAWKGEYKRDSKKIRKVKLQLSMYREALQDDLPLLLVVFQTNGTYDFEELPFDSSAIDWWTDNRESFNI